jgi:hypothetical protein
VDLKSLDSLTRTELQGLLEDAAMNWLALDGLWFQAVERTLGTDTASCCGRSAIGAYSEIEAKRIIRRFNITQTGIPALMQALRLRLYHLINRQDVIEVSESRCVFRMLECRVQEARKRKGLPQYPCKPVGMAEYSRFAAAIDPGIRTRCIACPPDDRAEGFWCAWEFSKER